MAIFAFNVSFPLIVLVAGVLGYLGGRWRPASCGGRDDRQRALFFGYHVIWPEGFAGRFDWASALIAAAAALLLLRCKRGVIEVIALCAVLGLVVHLIRG